MQPAPASKLAINGLEAIANRLGACGAGHVEKNVDFLAPKKYDSNQRYVLLQNKCLFAIYMIFGVLCFFAAEFLVGKALSQAT